MSLIIIISVFIVSCIVIYFAGEWVVDGVMSVAKYLGWKEFVLSFLVMAFFGSLPNLFVGITSALQGIPELSLGDIISGNIIDLTLVLALPILLTGRAILTESRTINMTLFFTLGAITLPLILSLDGLLSRADGIILIFFYFTYIFWLFAKKERFIKIYDNDCKPKNDLGKAFLAFIQNLFKTLGGIILIIIASQGIVWAAQGVAEGLSMPVILVGIFIVSFGNAVPELYFTLKCSQKQNCYMLLGNIMGCVIIPATLILGIVSLITPITINNLDNLAIARVFLFIACIFFFIFGITGKKISLKEAWVLVAVYAAFLISEVVISL